VFGLKCSEREAQSGRKLWWRKGDLWFLGRGSRADLRSFDRVVSATTRAILNIKKLKKKSLLYYFNFYLF
jgi:hypothetical protein